MMGMCSMGDLQKPCVCRPVCLICGPCRAGLALQAGTLARAILQSAGKSSLPPNTVPTFCHSSRTGRPCFSLFFFFSKVFFFNFIYLFIYLWLCWVFVSVRGLSLVAASGGHSSSRCAGLSSSRPLLLRSTDSRCAGSVIVAHGPTCSAACGIFPEQGSNPCPLRWQADSQPLHHQGSPLAFLLKWKCLLRSCIQIGRAHV